MRYEHSDNHKENEDMEPILTRGHQAMIVKWIDLG